VGRNFIISLKFTVHEKKTTRIISICGLHYSDDGFDFFRLKRIMAFFEKTRGTVHSEKLQRLGES
jgi:hypothetical protein